MADKKAVPADERRAGALRHTPLVHPPVPSVRRAVEKLERVTWLGDEPKEGYDGEPVKTATTDTTDTGE